MITSANTNRKLHREKKNSVPDSSKNYKIVIRKGMKINRGTREKFTDTISPKKSGNMLKMIKENNNKRIFN